MSEAILQRFAKLLKNGRLAHAYLLVGPEGIGKETLALEIGKLVNCEENDDFQREAACQTCPSCRKVISGNHPDVWVIKSGEEQSIKIARIRELINRIQLRPYEARKKVYILKDVHELTLEGSNALLKTLEEPVKDTLLILTTSSPEKMLSTVKSRCHHMHIFAVANDRLQAQMEKEESVTKEEAHFLACFSEGCVGRARKLKEQGFFQDKNVVIDNMILNRSDEAYVKTVLADKEQTKQVLNVFLTWFRDLMLLKVMGMSGIDDDMIHSDRTQDLLSAESRYSFQQIKEIISNIIKTLRLLDQNLNVKISLNLLLECL